MQIAKPLTTDEMLEYFEQEHPEYEENEFMTIVHGLIADGKITFDPYDRRPTRDGGNQGVLRAVRPYSLH